MDPVEENPKLIYNLVLDDNKDVATSKRRGVCIAAALMALYYAGTNLRHVWRIRRYRHLNCPKLLENPRLDTPWQAVLCSCKDCAFISTMGVDVATFNYILLSGFCYLWLTHPIPRDDVNPSGATQLGQRSLDAEGGLGVLLHYLSGTMNKTSLQQIFALVPLVLTSRICWPKPDKMQEYLQAIQLRHPSVIGGFGFLDGLSLPIGASSDADIKSLCPNGCVIAAKVNAPGSWHNSRTAAHIYNLLQDKTPAGFFLIADTAFPCAGGNDLAGKIKTLLKHKDALPNNPIKAQDAIDYSNAITSA
ncbi:DDE superfamily endonuclease [Rhizoctonia solani]|uniref:DDE superfamily endonuclease n=1 Tax=Rhizoctonia solani TaxID=456999 RepID=A0A8H7LX76_9AGAM|nr:DDE superfamily endonuclease [Rhizoctonia solani]